MLPILFCKGKCHCPEQLWDLQLRKENKASSSEDRVDGRSEEPKLFAFGSPAPPPLRPTVVTGPHWKQGENHHSLAVRPTMSPAVGRSQNPKGSLFLKKASEVRFMGLIPYQLNQNLHRESTHMKGWEPLREIPELSCSCAQPRWFWYMPRIEGHSLEPLSVQGLDGRTKSPAPCPTRGHHCYLWACLRVYSCPAVQNSCVLAWPHSANLFPLITQKVASPQSLGVTRSYAAPGLTDVLEEKVNRCVQRSDHDCCQGRHLGWCSYS